MSTTTTTPSDTGSQRVPLLNKNVLRLLVVAAGATISFYTPLSAVPQFVQSQTGSSTAAGATTAVLMLATVITELFSVSLMRRWSPERLLLVGVALLGLPALALTVLPLDVSLVFAVCAARGIGFALTVVAGGTIASRSFPPERRGEGLGIYGVVFSGFAIVALPIGLVIGQRWGHPHLFAITAVSALAVLPAASRLTQTAPQPASALTRDGAKSTLSLIPALGFFGTTIASGLIITFLPITFSGLGNVATAAIAVQSLATTGARWLAGRIGDRRGHGPLLAKGIVLAAIGMATLAVTDSGPGVTAAMVVFGVGFGVTMSASLAIMLEHSPPSQYGTVNAQWNLAYDIGWGIGSIGFGILLNTLAYQTGYMLVAGLVALPLFLVARRVPRTTTTIDAVGAIPVTRKPRRIGQRRDE